MGPKLQLCAAMLRVFNALTIALCNVWVAVIIAALAWSVFELNCPTSVAAIPTCDRLVPFKEQAQDNVTK